MSLIAGALGYGRRLAASRFTETLVFGRYRDGTDPVTGDPTRVLVGAPSYEGPGQVKYPSVNATPADIASQVVTAQSVVVKLPSGTIVPVGDEGRVTASTVDPSLVGSSYRVTGAAQKGQTTSARYPVIELS